MEAVMKRVLVAVALLASLAPAPRLLAFCGFYVGRADSRLFNRASQVALVRDGDRTVLTMANDFQGELQEFALVVPVPTFIARNQIQVVNKALLDHLDAYSAPRLVEYHDPDPCRPPDVVAFSAIPEAAPVPAGARPRRGVTVEATYTVGEYDILILSAKESDGLELWLRENGYKIPGGASSILGSYIKQGMRFFVARVNLKEQAKLGFQFLRPLQVSYESPKFMLPIRLGTVNANGPQDLFIYTLTRKGRVETTNYRTVRVPSNVNVPRFVKREFKDFYKAVFEEQVRMEDMRAVFLEYAWDMAWCDPCAADPLSDEELKALGVAWVGTDASPSAVTRPIPLPRPAPPAPNVFVSRLHVRYDAQHFPEDLVFQETADRENFQARYVVTNPWEGAAGECPAAKGYKEELRAREEKEAQNAASLTGWSIHTVRQKMGGPRILGSAPEAPWYRRAWAALVDATARAMN
jgi:hypothetical protein